MESMLKKIKLSHETVVLCWYPCLQVKRNLCFHVYYSGIHDSICTKLGEVLFSPKSPFCPHNENILQMWLACCEYSHIPKMSYEFLIFLLTRYSLCCICFTYILGVIDKSFLYVTKFWLPAF